MVYVKIYYHWIGDNLPSYCPTCKKEDCMEYFAQGKLGGVYKCDNCGTYVEWDETSILSDTERSTK